MVFCDTVISGGITPAVLASHQMSRTFLSAVKSASEVIGKLFFLLKYKRG